MKPKLIAFDFDGTIADTLGEMQVIINEMALDYNFRQLRADEISKLRQLSVKELLKELGISKLQAPKLLTRGLCMLRSRIDRVEVIEGMKETLFELQPKVEHFGMLTSNSSENVELFLKHHGMDHLFHFISSKSKLSGKAKHLKSILRTFSLTSEDVLYVGDEIRDVVACQKVGIPIAAVSWGFNAREALEKSKPDFLFDDPQQLRDLVD